MQINEHVGKNNMHKNASHIKIHNIKFEEGV